MPGVVSETSAPRGRSINVIHVRQRRTIVLFSSILAIENVQ